MDCISFNNKDILSTWNKLTEKKLPLPTTFSTTKLKTFTSLMQARVRDLNYSAIGKQIKRQIMYTRQEMDIK